MTELMWQAASFRAGLAGNAERFAKECVQNQYWQCGSKGDCGLDYRCWALVDKSATGLGRKAESGLTQSSLTTLTETMTADCHLVGHRDLVTELELCRFPVAFDVSDFALAETVSTALPLTNQARFLPLTFGFSGQLENTARSVERQWWWHFEPDRDLSPCQLTG